MYAYKCGSLIRPKYLKYAINILENWFHGVNNPVHEVITIIII